MSDNNNTQSSSRPMIRTLKTVLLLAFLFLCYQVYLNPPEERSRVACWPAYKIHRFFTVRAAQNLRVNDFELQLKAIQANEQFYYECTRLLGKLPGFKPMKANANPIASNH